jgi:signal recognition particle subunit SRP54
VDFRKMIVRTRNQVRNQRTVNKVLGIIDAMTPEERCKPKDILNESRRSRVAKGAGVTPGDVSNLVNHFDRLANWLKKVAGMSVVERMREIPNA